MRVVVLGAPGAGKTVQSQRLARHLGLPAVSACDAFRSSVVRHTALGAKAQQFTDAEGFLPDDLTGAMVRDRLEHAGPGFVLDGYPQSMDQVEELDHVLDGEPLHAVIVLAVRFRDLVERLVLRAEAEGTISGAHETVARRQESFALHTAPVIGEYTRRGLLTVIDGTGSVSEIAGRLSSKVGKVFAP